MVVRRQVQIGLVRALRHPELAVVPLYEDELVLVTDPGHPFAVRREIALEAIAGERLILFDRASSYHDLTSAFLGEAGVIPAGSMELDNIDATKKMVAQGLGVALLPRYGRRRGARPPGGWSRSASWTPRRCGAGSSPSTGGSWRRQAGSRASSSTPSPRCARSCGWRAVPSGLEILPGSTASLRLMTRRLVPVGLLIAALAAAGCGSASSPTSRRSTPPPSRRRTSSSWPRSLLPGPRRPVAPTSRSRWRPMWRARPRALR